MWPFARKAPAGSPASGLGRQGEDLARRFLRRRGMKILARNYRCPVGEADLIALDRSGAASGAIVFVEVKSRAAGQLADPQSAVNADKRRRIRKVAAYYLRTHDAEGYAARFDVVTVVVTEGRPPEIQHIPDAF